MKILLDEEDYKTLKFENHGRKLLYSLNNKKYFFKEISHLEKLYNELIAQEIAKRVKIPNCKYYYTEVDEYIGVSSEYFEHEKAMTIEEYLKTKVKEENVSDYNNLEDLWNFFTIDFGFEKAQKLIDSLINIFLFDAVLGNCDRNVTNLQIIVDKDNPFFGPLYDNENIASEEALYGNYSLGVDREDYKNIDNHNILYKFLDQCSKEHKDKLLRYLYEIEEDKLESIFIKIENEGIYVSEYIKEKIIKKLLMNKNMILKYFNTKKEVK